MIKGVLLDVDGTLVLSNDAHARAWVKALARHGHQIQFDQVRRLIGMGGDKIIPTLLPDLAADSETGEQISVDRRRIMAKDYVPNLKPAPGARRLIERMKHEGLRLVVASSAQGDELEGLLKAAEVDDLLAEHPTTTASEVDNSKPDPDIVAAALKKIDLPAEQVLMLGDTPYDIEAAAKANVGVIALRCGGFSDPELAEALAIYDDPADLLAHYEESPLVN